MKKIIFFTLLLIFAAAPGFAQLDLKPAIGMNASRFDDDPIMDDGNDSLQAGSRAGYQIGASLEIGNKIYLEPGIFYNKFNQSFTPTDFEKSDFDFNTSSIRVPVYLGWRFFGNTRSLAGFRIFVGPSVFIPLSVKENNYPVDMDDLKKPQFDFSAGAGLNIWHLFLDVSYGWGLSPMFKDDPIESEIQSFYANVGFRLKLKNEEQ